MDFGEAISTAWKVIWKHKILWIFGILAGCSGRSGGSGINYSFNNRAGTGSSQFPYQIERFFQSIPTWVWIALAAGLLLLILLALFLGTVGRIGLIRGTIDADEGAERLSFGPLFSASLPYFWRVFLLNFLLGLMGLILVLVLVVPSILAIVATQGIGALVIVPMMCISFLCLGLVFWVLGIILEQATVAIVAENLGLVEGFQRGWSVFRANLGSLIVIAIFIAILGGIVGFILSIPFVFLLLPIFLADVSGGIFQGGNFARVSIMVALLVLLIYLPIAIFAGGVLQSYTGALWTLTFRRLTRKPLSVAPDRPTGAAVY